MDNLDEILKKIQVIVTDTMTKDIKEEVQDTMAQHIQSDVYGAYSPSVYERRGSGGLGSKDNTKMTELVSTPSEVSITMENTTTGRTPTSTGYYNNGVRIDYMIETGEYMWGNVGARPFIANTANELDGKWEEKLRRGLNARGLDV